jgi:lysozyme
MPTNVNILPPGGRPKLTRTDLEARLEPLKAEWASHELIVVGLRGYFPKSLGPTAGNDRNVYDDAIALFVPSLDLFAAFNGNTDPSRVRNGFGTANGTKGMAVLDPGVWPVYRFDIHHGSAPHEAICERGGPVRVMRDAAVPYPDVGNHGINIHRGGYYTTSSLGCQTVPPEQWGEFYGLASDAARRLWNSSWREKNVAYVLLNA